MIIVKINKPGTGLMPRSTRKVAALLGLGIAISMEKTGKVSEVKAYLWRRHPDVVSLGRYREVTIDLPRRLVDAVELAEKLVEEMDKYGGGLPRGVTITVSGVLDRAELTVDIDVYSSEEVPRALGITDRLAAVVAEPRGYVDGKSIGSFYELMSLAGMEQFMRELYAQIAPVDLTVATYMGPRRLGLAELTGWVKVSRNYGLDLKNAVPTLYNPWAEQLARDLYAMATSLKRLAGAQGFRRVVREDREALLSFLRKYYRVELHLRNLMTLYPRASSPPTKTHEEAVERLAKAVEKALEQASSRQTIETLLEKEGVLTWEHYVEVLTTEFRKQLE